MKTSHAAITAATTRVHRFLRSRRSELGDRVRDNMIGMCATGAALLLRELRALKIGAELVCARAVYGNVIHYWVLADGFHADPTHLQFSGATPWRVSSEAPQLTYHDQPCSWAVESDFAERLVARQHPRTHWPLLGLGPYPGLK